jgi:hypothetical protein
LINRKEGFIVKYLFLIIFLVFSFTLIAQVKEGIYLNCHLDSNSNVDEKAFIDLAECRTIFLDTFNIMDFPFKDYNVLPNSLQLKLLRHKVTKLLGIELYGSETPLDSLRALDFYLVGQLNFTLECGRNTYLVIVNDPGKYRSFNKLIGLNFEAGGLKSIVLLAYKYYQAGEWEMTSSIKGKGCGQKTIQTKQSVIWHNVLDTLYYWEESFKIHANKLIKQSESGRKTKVIE